MARLSRTTEDPPTLHPSSRPATARSELDLDAAAVGELRARVERFIAHVRVYRRVARHLQVNAAIDGEGIHPTVLSLRRERTSGWCLGKGGGQ